MASAQRLTFIPVTHEVLEPVTKFGGQPHWIDTPRWPLSRQTGKPMQLIAQIALAPPLFSGTGGRMAFLFMTGDEEFVDSTWEPDGGENAVLIQPGTFAGPSEARACGPSLYRMVQVPGEDRLRREPVEMRVEQTPVQEPDYRPDAERDAWSAEQGEQYAAALEGNKLGGSPLFVQGDEFPDGAQWNPLLQLDSADVPFYVNFGDGGVGYAFIDAREREGKFLWQCG